MNETGTDSALKEAQLLLELARDVSASLDLQEVLDKSLSALRSLISFDGGSIQLIFGDALQLVAADPPAPPEVYEFRLPLGEGFGGRVAVTGEPIYSADATIDERAHPEGRRKASVAGVRSYLAAPLIEHGAPIGIVQFDSLTVDAFPPHAQAMVLAFLPTITAAVQNARLFSRELETIEHLREAEQMKHDFLAIVSHELRTPMVSVIGFAELLRARAEELDPSSVSDFAQRILRASSSLMRSIEDVLDIANIERGLLHVEKAPTDLGQLLKAVLAETTEQPELISVEVDDSLPLVDVDPNRFGQVMNNLLSNARKFSDPHKPIVVRARREGDRVAVDVTDEGRGMSTEVASHVFERFYQAEPATTRSTGGLGIGLYMVRRLCELMGAEVRIESAEGKGSTVTVVLNAAR